MNRKIQFISLILICLSVISCRSWDDGYDDPIYQDIYQAYKDFPTKCKKDDFILTGQQEVTKLFYCILICPNGVIFLPYKGKQDFLVSLGLITLYTV